MKLTYSLESVLHTDFSEDITCIGLEFHKFLADLELTAFHEYKETEDYPEEVFHATMAGLLEQLGEDELELPLLFTVELDKEMSLFGFPFRYTFLLAGREHFHSLGYAGMNTRRGRVGHQIAHTLTTGIQQGTLHFVDLSVPPLVTEQCRCLNTRQSGIHNHKGECSGVLKEEGARAVLTPGREETRQNGRRMKEPEEPMFTITATDRHGVAYRGRIRRLVPRECLRLQGFYDWQIDRIEQETSDSQLYKQAGNGVTVNVIEAIGTLLRQADTEIRAEDEKTKR